MQPGNSNSILLKDFSAGWCPSDDPVNGRKNCLLKMDSVTLDENGALTLAQGMTKVYGPYVSDAHSLFVKQICGERRSYVGLADGSVWRNATNLVAVGAGSTHRAAFGVYGDYVLVISGDKRIKDTCSDFNENGGALGLSAPTVAPLVNIFNGYGVDDSLGTLTNWQGDLGTFSLIGGDTLNIQTTTLSLTGNRGSAFNHNISDFPPKDLSGTDDDVFSFEFKIDDAVKLGTTGYIYLQFSISDTPGIFDESYTKSYWVRFESANIMASLSNGDFVTLSKKRSDFTRYDTDSPIDWHNVVGVDIVIGTDGLELPADCYLRNFKLTKQTANPGNDIEGNLNGTYEWVQVNVLSRGGYVAMSKAGPITDEYTVVNGYAEIIPQDPTLIEMQTNEVWIFRRGGTLDKFYRVGVIPYDSLGPLYDSMSDLDALTLGIVLNTNILSINSTDLPDNIIEIVGPVFGRMLYLSSSKIFFSEVSNPDVYDPRNTINVASDEAETIQWARKVSENIVMIGTLRDVYILTGTYVQFPDGALDVYLRNLGVNKPPMSRFVTTFNGQIIYFASQEWIIMSPSGQYQSLVSPNTDILYTGQTKAGYGGVPTFIDDTDVFYSCASSKNRLWVSVPVITDYSDPINKSLLAYRMEIFDFGRKYWRPVSYAPRLLAINDDDSLWGFFNETMTVNYMDSPFNRLLNYT